jgi:membrane peptidoglycan carboxypeptidase
MKRYLENHSIYVINGENLVYKVGEYEAFDNADYLLFELELVAGLDYVDVDYSDIQDWVSADNYIDDVQYEYINQYFLVEGTKEALEANGYTILTEIDYNLQAIIDKHNEA